MFEFITSEGAGFDFFFFFCRDETAFNGLLSCRHFGLRFELGNQFPFTIFTFLNKSPALSTPLAANAIVHDVFQG